MIIFVGCGNENNDSQNPISNMSSSLADENYNLNIKTEDITVIPIRETMTTTYDHVMLEITNNSSYPLYLNNTYNIYEKIGDDYNLIDANNDGATYDEIINCGDSIKKRFYLGELITNDYTRAGNYRIEIPISAEKKLTVDFKIIDDSILLDTGISIHTPKDKYTIDNDAEFSYMITNHSQTTINVTLAVAISQYRNGQWVKLPFTDVYNELYYNATLSTNSCNANSQLKQSFKLSLVDMIDTELTPGRYRLEKEILFDWYFTEFELY
ncbi:MAG: hypothetical protein RSF40_09870 [Oscillospiraceae bacterium]